MWAWETQGLYVGKPKSVLFAYKNIFNWSFVLFEVNQAVKEINEALNNNSEEALTLALSNRAARLSGVVGENGPWYMKMLEEKRKIKQEVFQQLLHTLCVLF